MTRILYLQSSLFGEDGQSSRMARTFIDGYRQRHPDTEVVTRDLVADGVPHLDLARAGALRGFSESLDDNQKAVLAHSDALVQELRDADLVVIGMPMYNFGAPTQFKAWIDHIARAGVTFKYTETGPVGLIDDKPVRVFAAHGGVHAGQPYETTTAFVKQIFGFMGIQDVRFVYAEGLNISDEVKRQALARADAETAAELTALETAEA
ncbi:ACP phosphodieterase [Alcanivorax sp. 521-1]|uniref:FMN dependent NADH:quinone oxidoreductase n=1 Tax=Alloalcanivorax profundimaris TaxID=2735259 RepID=A0ABS0AT58_9GAMM|nr:NAD(P)H-dependent oxidoreductase [Alloalcanivorax profundimaris]MBF5057144.1 ACP phosphodieterase [Alloalcanivorax profundimaris]